jgi:hypothetical protein
MNEIHKTHFLAVINEHDINLLMQHIKDETFGNLEETLRDYREAGLSPVKLESIQKELKKDEAAHTVSAQANEFREKLRNRTLRYEELKSGIKKHDLKNNDLLGCGLSQGLVNAIQIEMERKGSESHEITVDDLPDLPSDRVDLYFIGVPRSGKSCVLASLLKTAFQTGCLEMESGDNHKGINYGNQIIDSMLKDILPRPTARGMYCFLEHALIDQNEKPHKINFLEIPGENYLRVTEREKDQLISHIQNDNSKVLIFVIDSDAFGTSGIISDSYNQGVVFSNLISIFQNNKVMENTLAVYILINKIDLLKSRYPDRSELEIAQHIIDTETNNLKNFKEQLLRIRNRSSNKFDIILFPYSVGNVVFEKFVEQADDSYAKNVFHALIHNTFYSEVSLWDKYLK